MLETKAFHRSTRVACAGVMLTCTVARAQAPAPAPSALPLPGPTLAPQPIPARAAASSAHAPTAEVAPSAGYSQKDGFFLRSDDGNYLTAINLQLSYKFEPILLDGEMQNRSMFYVLRPAWQGHVSRPWLKYRLALELANDPVYLLDSWFEVAPSDAFSARFGLQVTPISRHEWFNPADILFPDYSLVAGYFWPGRDKGITLKGVLPGGKLEYYAGLYSGSPARQITVISGNYLTLARLTWNPFGAMGATEYPYISSDDQPTPLRASFSLQGWASKINAGRENFNPATFRLDVTPSGVTSENLAAGADVFLQGERFALLAEGFARRTDPGADDGLDPGAHTSIGAWAQVGVLVYEKLLDVALRFNWLDPSEDLVDDQAIAAEAQVVYYIDVDRLNLHLRYGLGHQASPGDDALQGVTLPIATPGTYNVFTLQLNLAL